MTESRSISVAESAISLSASTAKFVYVAQEILRNDPLRELPDKKFDLRAWNLRIRSRFEVRWKTGTFYGFLAGGARKVWDVFEARRRIFWSR